MDETAIVKFEIDTGFYSLEDFGISDLTSINCRFFVNDDYVVYGEEFVELKSAENKALTRLLDKQIKQTIKIIKGQNLRSLVFLDQITLAIEQQLLVYCEKHPYIQLVEISINDLVSTYRNPVLHKQLNEFADKANADFMRLMDSGSTKALADYLINQHSLLGFDIDDYAFDEDDYEDDDDYGLDSGFGQASDQESKGGNNILKFPNDKPPF